MMPRVQIDNEIFDISDDEASEGGFTPEGMSDYGRKTEQENN